jgi:diguanylate cyclase (GGDEF)-like protein
VLFDIDWFKSINDDFGHLGGDAALRELAERIRRSSVRREDLFSRFGGEEFALVLVETGRDEALQVAERIRRTVEAQPFRFDDRSFHMTVSVGVACTRGDSEMTANQLVRLADDNLYRAKHAGRNRVVG